MGYVKDGYSPSFGLKEMSILLSLIHIFLLLTFVCFTLFAPIETLIEVMPGLSIVAIIVTEMSKN